ncbi:MAG: citrate synthase [Candidatus Palauibacterales bacterium]|nr:citrate synthase [Candidatus Palauibacterales bacterium]
MAERIKRIGLDNVVATETELSYIDGQEGVLLYRGYNIHDLAENATYPEALYLLWNGELPTAGELESFRDDLAGQRAVDERVIEVLRQMPDDADPMGVLRTAVSTLGNLDSRADETSEEANRGKARRLVAKFPTVVAAYHRLREGREPVAPDPSLGHAANFLYMLHGEEPDDVAAEALDTSLLLYLDHGLNASTFTCRVISSTLSDIYSAVTGGVGALKGELHGGANEAAMRMILEIESVDRAEKWVDDALDKGKKIMGFGHRVYRTEDPRATHLREMSRRIGESTGETKWYEISKRVEETMLDRKGINCNVDFYCASVYYSLGLPLDLYTPLFAMGRVGGWSAHVLEQLSDNRLIRPRAEYVGETDASWTPVDER